MVVSRIYIILQHGGDGVFTKEFDILYLAAIYLPHKGKDHKYI